jgi:hypothetical protein
VEFQTAIGLAGLPWIKVVTGTPTTFSACALVITYTPSAFVMKNGGGVEDRLEVVDRDGV